jgi:hypothetical protein
MTAYRFVHAADVHLDSPLRSLALRDPRLAEFVGNASRQVFSRIQQDDLSTYRRLARREYPFGILEARRLRTKAT